MWVKIKGVLYLLGAAASAMLVLSVNQAELDWLFKMALAVLAWGYAYTAYTHLRSDHYLREHLASKLIDAVIVIMVVVTAYVLVVNHW